MHNTVNNSSRLPISAYIHAVIIYINHLKMYEKQTVQGGREVTVHTDNMHLRLNLILHSTAQHSTQCNVKWQFDNSVQDSAYVICRSHRI
jgi:hypothetical protein